MALLLIDSLDSYPLVWNRAPFKLNSPEDEQSFYRACNSIINKLDHLTRLIDAVTEHGLTQGPALLQQKFRDSVASNFYHVLKPVYEKIGGSVLQGSGPRPKIPDGPGLKWNDLHDDIDGL